jgi:hypothetical protein
LPKLIDRTGHVYGRLTVIGRDESVGPASRGKRTKWVCECSCGATKVATGHELSCGDTKSCGCFRNDENISRQRTHGMARTPTYRSWQAAKERCYNPSNSHYGVYGAVGITMENEWKESFEAFLSDMGTRPLGMTLDRIDNSKGYARDNCRWATHKMQTLNRATSRVWNGRRRTLREIAEISGVPRTSLGKHIRRLGDIDEALAYVKDRMKT